MVLHFTDAEYNLRLSSIWVACDFLELEDDSEAESDASSSCVDKLRPSSTTCRTYISSDKESVLELGELEHFH